MADFKAHTSVGTLWGLLLGTVSVISDFCSLIVGWKWAKDKSGKFGYRCDRIHLNNRGQYLQACVWYGALFKKSPLEIKYVGAEITPEDAELMKKCADKALREYK